MGEREGGGGGESRTRGEGCEGGLLCCVRGIGYASVGGLQYIVSLREDKDVRGVSSTCFCRTYPATMRRLLSGREKNRVSGRHEQV